MTASMPSAHYPEIEALQRLREQHPLQVTRVEQVTLCGDDSYPAVCLRIAGQVHSLYVHDEYGDLQCEQPLLALCLVLMELETYAEAADFPVWSREQGLNPATPAARRYHMDLATVYRQVSEVLGVIRCPLRPLDFELNAGAAQALRNGAGQSCNPLRTVPPARP